MGWPRPCGRSTTRIATRLVLYNALADPERIERYGEVARQLQTR